jgi:2-polyprenyl-3-methyl-5-hydroxy-6-metoxy-1,4-benzoquinol methylase
MNCPFCKSGTTRIILKRPTWLVEACLRCTNAWTTPAPKGVDYGKEDFHSQFDYRKISELPGQWKKAVLLNADLLSHYLGPNDKILEIGCGEGIFLRELRSRGFRVTGIEPSDKASQRARDSGVRVFTAFFPNVEIGDEFDAVVMSHVLEHVPEPVQFLKEAGKLTPKGMILLTQSNWRGLVPKFQKERWHAWVPEHHFWHFSDRGLEYILKTLDWGIETIKYSSLHHGNSILSRMGAAIPGLGDQFHIAAKTSL